MLGHLTDRRADRTTRHHTAPVQDQQVGRSWGHLVRSRGEDYDSCVSSHEAIQGLREASTGSRIESRKWIVEKEQARALHQSSGDDQLSPFTGGQLDDPSAEESLDSEQPEHGLPLPGVSALPLDERGADFEGIDLEDVFPR
jgi:hypothetical protein